jgi:FtsH-binding integral membrane protein
MDAGIYLAASFIPSVAYSSHGMSGVIIGYCLSTVIQFAVLGLYIKRNNGPVASFIDVYTVILAGLAIGAVTLAYSMRNFMGLFLGAALSLLTQSIAINGADKVFSKEA